MLSIFVFMLSPALLFFGLTGDFLLALNLLNLFIVIVLVHFYFKSRFVFLLIVSHVGLIGFETIRLPMLQVLTLLPELLLLAQYTLAFLFSEMLLLPLFTLLQLLLPELIDETIVVNKCTI